MKLPLRARFSIYGLACAGYLAGLVGTVAFVGLPALWRVDRSLAPIQSVFAAIAERQNRVVRNIEMLDRLSQLPAPPQQHEGVALQKPRDTKVPGSLLSLYGSILDSAAARRLAVAEDELGAIESAFGEAVALYQIGERTGLTRKIAELRAAEGRSRQYYNEVMSLALSSGLTARAAFQKSVGMLAWLGALWLLIGVGLVLAIAWDANRHVWLPIRALDQRVREIAQGDWSHPVAIEPGDELGELATQFNNLTETLQRRAGQHAQLATAGELLAGVAHELNNPLQAIRGTAELKAAGESGRGDWAMVLAQAERASKLARDLVQFVRPAARDESLVSINDVVRTGVNLIEFQYRADGVGLELDLAPGLPSVRADRHELAQVIVNLLGNAHAVLTRSSGPRRVFVRTWTDDSRVCCTVRDTGPGIPEGIHERVFSPFFSTKASGVGLGFTVSRNILRTAGGELRLDQGGPGASFTLWLPGDAAAPATPRDSHPKAVRPASRVSPLHGATVLVADDEDAIRGVLERFFTRDGATVIMANGGKPALEALRTRTVDVAVLDVRMPDMDGAAVYRTIKAERPELAAKVIFLSGDVTSVTEELDVPKERVLVKPVELADLKRAVLQIAQAGGQGSGASAA